MAGHEWLFLHEGVFPSAKPKNCENQREYHDVIEAMVELRGREFARFKGLGVKRLDCRYPVYYLCARYMMNTKPVKN